MTSVLVFASSLKTQTKGCYLQITFIGTDNISVVQQSPQMKMGFYLQNRTLGTGRV